MAEKDGKKAQVSIDELEERMEESWQMLLGIGLASITAPDVPSEKKSSISFTLITGFLGSGKTTLLNSLLSETHGTRLAVIVNDFGSINIDASLIEKDSVNKIELSNGCVCCTLANGLTATLGELASQAEPPEQIILEASGIADPNGITQVALCNPALHFNGIVCIVDASSILENIDTPLILTTIDRQLSAANLILLNKVDIVEADMLEAVEQWLGEQNFSGRIVKTAFSNIPLSIVLDHPDRPYSPQISVDKSHANSFESFAFKSELLIDETKLCSLIETLPVGVLRLKGILRLDSDPTQQAVLHVTGNRWSLQKGRQLSDSQESEVIAIGISGEIDWDSLLKRFKSCRIL